MNDRSRLPYDYARCGPARDTCPLASRCLRTSKGNGRYQPYSYFPGGTDCPGFIEGEPE